MNDSVSRSNHADRIKLPGSPLSHLDRDLEPLAEVVLHNHGRHAFYKKDQSVLHALDTVFAISNLLQERGVDDPAQTVEIPVWVLNAISDKYASYADAHATNRSTSLGEAFGIEGGGQGKQPKVRSHLKEIRNRSLCLTIAFKIRRTGKTPEEICSELAADEARNAKDTESGITVDHLLKIWKRLGSEANNALDRALKEFKDKLPIRDFAK